MCQANYNRLTLVRDVCADDIGVLALSLVRFMAAGYMTRDVACWESAHDIAESALGATDGQTFVAAMMGVMRAIRAERSEDWPFMPASCCRVTPAEEELVRVFAAARAGEAGRLAEAARSITGGSAQRLCAAAFIAADLMETHAAFRVARPAESRGQRSQKSPGSARLH
jgi:hypothetical protein